MGSALSNTTKLSAVTPDCTYGGRPSPRTEKEQNGRTSPSLFSAGVVRLGGGSMERIARISFGPSPPPPTVAERSLAEMECGEVSAWLRRPERGLPASVEVDALCASLEARHVRGDQLVDMTSRELRDDVGIKPLAWRKAVLREVRAEVARELAVASAAGPLPESDPSALSLSGSFKFSFAAMQAAQSSFAVRKNANQLAPLDGNAEAPSGSTQQRPDRMTWPNKRPNFWRRPSASPERASERAAADGPAVDDDDACNSSDSSLRGRITSLRRSIAARRRSPSPNPARGVAVPDAAVEAVPDPPPAVCLATHATHQHDTPREPSPEKQARRRRDGSSIN